MIEKITIQQQIRAIEATIAHASSHGLHYEQQIAEEILKNLEKIKNPWNPIETAPKDGTRVLLCFQTGKQTVARWTDGTLTKAGIHIGWVIYGNEEHWFAKWMPWKNIILTLDKNCLPTHWQHLPESPYGYAS